MTDVLIHENINEFINDEINDEINYELISIYIDIAEDIYKLDTIIQKYLILDIEEYYETEADNELGDFLNNYFLLVLSNQENELHLEIQDLIDDSELNEDMLICVGKHIQEIIEDKKDTWQIL